MTQPDGSAFGAATLEEWRATGEEAAQYLQDLVRIDTSNPPGNERPAAEYLYRLLAAEGVETVVLGPEPARPSLVGRVRGDGARRPLLLVSHLDVVPAPPVGWAVNPFSGIRKDGFIWGRGAMDCKYRAVSHAMMLLLALRRRLPLKRDIIIAACADEEMGGRLGMQWLAEEHLETIDAEYVLGEGGGCEIPAPRGSFCAVGAGERGSAEVVLVFRGPGGHSLKLQPENPLIRLGQVLARLEEQRLSTALTPVAEEMIRGIAAVQEPQVRQALDALLSEDTREAGMQALQTVAPDLKRWLEPSLYTAVAATMVSGGSSAHAYPTEVKLTCNLRLLPGYSIEAAIQSLQERLLDVPGWEIAEVQESSLPSESPTGTELYAAIRDLYREIRPATSVVPWLLGGATDVRFLRGTGRAVYGFFPSIIDLPFQEWNSITHGVNERISLDNLTWAISVLYRLVVRLCV